MKLIKTIELNCFGDSQVKEWEKVCKEIEIKNQELLTNAPVVEQQKKTYLHQNTLFGEDSRWIETDELGVRVLGIDAPQVVGEVVSYKQHRVRLHSVEKVQMKAEVKLISFPEKPGVKLLDGEGAINVVRNYVDPNFDIGHWSNIYYAKKDGYFEFESWIRNEFKKVIVDIIPWGQRGKKLRPVEGCSKVYEVYRVYSDRFEVWEYQTPFYTPTKLGVGGGDGASTSLESDGFWNK